MEDPYYFARSRVQRDMDSAREMFTEWRQLAQGTPISTANPKLDLFSRKVNETLTSCLKDAQSLARACEVAKTRALPIDPAELERRLVDSGQLITELETMKKELSLDTQKREAQAPRGLDRISGISITDSGAARSAQSTPAIGRAAGTMDAAGRQRDESRDAVNCVDRIMADYELMKQDQIRMDIDRDAGQMIEVVQRIKLMSQKFSDELDRQQVILDDTSDKMSATNEEIKKTTKKVDKLLKKMHKRKPHVLIGVGAALIVIAVLLFIFV